jgi:uncharacterized membrane protein
MLRLGSQKKFGQRTKKYRNLNSRGSYGVNSGVIRKVVTWLVIAASGFFMAILFVSDIQSWTAVHPWFLVSSVATMLTVHPDRDLFCQAREGYSVLQIGIKP